jgi:SAM-dependent methyltransferase
VPRSSRGYSEDLAYIHDAGFGAFARQAAPAVLRLLRARGIRNGLVVDVGCGSGIFAARLLQEGYGVLGIDVSASMVALARRRAPAGRFVRQSFLRARLPRCRAITALGECVSYAFDGRHSFRALAAFFVRAHAALVPGGLLVFDLLEPGSRPPRRTWRAGKDWAVLANVTERRGWLTREISVFRACPRGYRRSEETHRLRLFRAPRVVEALERAGFEAEITTGFGRLRFEDHHAGFIARARAG